MFVSALTSSIPENAVLAGDEMRRWSDEIVPRCWKIVDQIRNSDDGFAPVNDDTRFHALVILAKMDPPADEQSSARWNVAAERISEILIHACTKHPDEYSQISTSLQPAAKPLIPHLSKVLGVTSEDLRNSLALSLLIDYLGADHATRTRLSLDASDWQIERMVPAVKTLDMSVLWKVLNTEEEYNDSPQEQNRVAHRRAMAFALLLTQ